MNRYEEVWDYDGVDKINDKTEQSLENDKGFFFVST